MAMLCFLPWATATETLQFRRYHVAPFSDAVASGEIPQEYRDATTTVLRAYGLTRAVDRRKVPLVRRRDVTFTAQLTDEQVGDYFEFRTRLTFAVLAARSFFTFRYANSDNTRLFIQGFTPESAGGALVETRRRDGVTRHIIPKGNLSVRRLEHVASWCELPKDLDMPLLTALEAAAAEGWWPAMAEAIWLFVGANTDSSDVSMHTELIDIVSAFSRLAGVWNEKGTVRAFVDALPSPHILDAQHFGPKAADPRIVARVAHGETVREIWLSDAYRLRSQLGHGHVGAPPYRSIWTVREHLLLAALALPLYLRALLNHHRLYSPSVDDAVTNVAFDALATLEPFAAKSTDCESPWNEIRDRARLLLWISANEQEFGGAPRVGGVSNEVDDSKEPDTR